jgi:ribosomal protein S18 acetylase RimI-like enzyme
MRMINIRYELNAAPTTLQPEAVLALLEETGISNPLWTVDRMARALKSSSVIVCAWHADQLVGFARVITDFAWFAYLSQLAVKPEFQNRGIGRELIARAQRQVGEEAGLLVHSADGAKEFYLAAGFKPRGNFFRLQRKR